MEAEEEQVMPMKPTRTQITQRKKRIDKLLRSAYASHKDHLSEFPHFRQYNTNGLSLFLESGRGDKLSSNLKQYIQELLKVNMEGPYGAEWPAEEKVKRREMSSPEALYIFVHKVPSTPDHAKASVIGFAQYRFTIEEEIPVLYVYELQLEPAYQGKGVGKFLMQLVELIACKNCMGAVVLTVQKTNTSAISFYLNKLRYNISSISPSKVYQQMGVDGQEKSYEILCKAFDHEAKAVLEDQVKRLLRLSDRDGEQFNKFHRIRDGQKRLQSSFPYPLIYLKALSSLYFSAVVPSLMHAFELLISPLLSDVPLN